MGAVLFVRLIKATARPSESMVFRTSAARARTAGSGWERAISRRCAWNESPAVGRFKASLAATRRPGFALDSAICARCDLYGSAFRLASRRASAMIALASLASAVASLWNLLSRILTNSSSPLWTYALRASRNLLGLLDGLLHENPQRARPAALVRLRKVVELTEQGPFNRERDKLLVGGVITHACSFSMRTRIWFVCSRIGPSLSDSKDEASRTNKARGRGRVQAGGTNSP